MSRSTKKPIVKINGYLKNLWWKILRRPKKQILKKISKEYSNNIFFNLIDYRDDIDDIETKSTIARSTKLNDYYYIDYWSISESDENKIKYSRK